MDSNYIYDIFGCTRKNNAPDLNIGMALLQQTKPIQDPAKLKEIREFIGRHYDTLTTAYQPHDRDAFAAAVAECEAEDAAARRNSNDG